MYSFKYSPRPNTLADKRMADGVPEGEKTRRIIELQRVQGAIQRELFEAMVGRQVDVLVEGPSRRRAWELTGRTSGWAAVNFQGDPALVGSVVPVRIVEAAPNSVRGELLAEA